ncbi:MAG: T9SS type A sorting domain-containing protein [Bacteroidia bacterium]|nr:T9SS type A sorting domain-containing protein [Bacteroidia bacterium]
MKKWFISFNVAIMSLLHSQVTLTQSNHAPIPGDNHPIKGFDTIANISNILNQNGNGILFNFSNAIVPNQTLFTNSYVTPSVLPGSSSFISMGANVALSDSGGFYKSSSASLEYCGHIGNSGEKMEFLIDKPILMQYPFSYGGFFSDAALGTLTTTLFPVFNLSGTILVSGASQGSLILPGIPAFNNVLRVVTNVTLLIQGTGSLSTVTGTQSFTQHDFYTNGIKFPVLSVKYEKVTIPAFSVNDYNVDRHYYGMYTLGISESGPNENNIKFYPTIVHDRLNIYSDNQYEIKIYTMDGSMIKKMIIQGKDEVDMSTWKSGVYLIISEDTKSKLQIVNKIVKL